MSIQWDAYEPYDPGVRGPLNELPRREAKAAFQRVVAARPARAEALRRLLRANGVTLGRSDVDVQALNDWFREHVERDRDNPERLRPLWYAVAHDIGLYLGDLLIERSPGLSWEFFTWGAKDLAYQRPVIMGFRGVPNRRYNVDPAWLVASYGHRIIAGEAVEEDLFLRMIQSAQTKAALP